MRASGLALMMWTCVAALAAAPATGPLNAAQKTPPSVAESEATSSSGSGDLPRPALKDWQKLHPNVTIIYPTISVAESEATISIGSSDLLRPALRAWQKFHPDVTIIYPTTSMEYDQIWQSGARDIFSYRGSIVHHLNDKRMARLKEVYPDGPPEQVVGYQALVAVVHPSNPIQSITLEQFRRVASHDVTPWRMLGRDSDEDVVKYWGSYSEASLALFDHKMKRIETLSPDIDPKNIDVNRNLSKEDSRKQAEYVNRHVKWFRHPWASELGKFLKTLAPDPNAFGIFVLTREVEASGLKILAIAPEAGQPPVAPTPENVATGKYPVPVPWYLIVHPKAGKATRDFVKWLETPEAFEVMKPHYFYVGRPPDRPLADTPLDVPSPPAEETVFRGPVSGAVAVLPTEPLSAYFLVADGGHHAAWEQTIADAIIADGRLTLVDRMQLARVLAERKLGLAGSENPPTGPLVAADIFVLLHVITEDVTTYLDILALHGPTAAKLGELRLRINPADPLRFIPPLEETVRRWWPGVLKRLVDARTRPVWVLQDVYGLDEQNAEAAQRTIRETLARNERIFFADGVDFGRSQQEVLMRLMGLSQAQGGRFTSAADYVVDARMAGSGKVELRLRDGGLTTLETGAIDKTEDAGWLAAVAEWLDKQIARHPDRLKPSQVQKQSPADDPWAKAQARVEYEAGQALMAEIERLDEARLAAIRAAGITYWSGEIESPDETEYCALAAWKHFRRAWLLDPTWEEPAFAAIVAFGRLGARIYGGTQFTQFHPFRLLRDAVEHAEQFMRTFPRSKYYEAVLAWYALEIAGVPHCLPAVVDARALKVETLRRSLVAMAEYLTRYPIPDRYNYGRDLGWISIPHFDHYLHCIWQYLVLAQPSDREMDQIVADWSARFDARTDGAPHSDFVRLWILQYKVDKPAYLALLTELQQRWPDPNHPQWKYTTHHINEALSRMFDIGGSDKSSFQLWERGLRGIGDLPCIGYDPAKDHKPAPLWE